MQYFKLENCVICLLEADDISDMISEGYSEGTELTDVPGAGEGDVGDDRDDRDDRVTTEDQDDDVDEEETRDKPPLRLVINFKIRFT